MASSQLGIRRVMQVLPIASPANGLPSRQLPVARGIQSRLLPLASGLGSRLLPRTSGQRSGLERHVYCQRLVSCHGLISCNAQVAGLVYSALRSPPTSTPHSLAFLP